MWIPQSRPQGRSRRFFPRATPRDDQESGERVWRFHNRLRWALWVALWLPIVIVALLVAQAF
jgi:hypothetical protein